LSNLIKFKQTEYLPYFLQTKTKKFKCFIPVLTKEDVKQEEEVEITSEEAKELIKPILENCYYRKILFFKTQRNGRYFTRKFLIF
jgi:hypothetical protein